ncbi:transcriptional regulator swi6 [Cryomyces antarcticus]|nr:transcriptional regulator swi6 [Cryomyces antarcticus]
MEAVRRLQYSKDPELDKEAETFTGHLTFTPREYSQIPTRVQDYPADEIPKPVLGQGQRQTTGSATREASHSRRLKRQLDETHDVEGASVRQQRASRSQASTGAPIEELPGYVQMTVEGKPISMRKADYWLNATQILLIAGKTENQRKEILDVLRKHTTVEVQKATKWTHHSTSWVCYEQGLLLCQALQLTDTLRPLLEHRHGSVIFDEQQVGQASYLPGYLRVNTGRHMVVIRKLDLRINGTHILKAAGQDRNAMVNLRESGIPFDIVRGHPKCQGTYVNFSQGLELCDKYGLDVLKRLLQRILQEHGNKQCDPPQPVATAKTYGMDSDSLNPSELLQTGLERPEHQSTQRQT